MTKDPAEGLANLKYGQAKTRLLEILDNLESHEVDLDDLADQVKEAAALLRVLNDKLTRTQVEVEDVMKQVRADDAPEGASAEEA